MNKRILSCVTITTISLILLTSFSTAFESNSRQDLSHSNISTKNDIELDVQYIYNITSALSNIIFEEYDEENGEIAKGRAFGTKGEHKAAKILFENMTLLGLDTALEQLCKSPEVPENIITKLEVLDFEAKVDGKKIECYIAPSWKGPYEEPRQLDYNFSYSGLKIKQIPKFPCLYNRKYAIESEDFAFIAKDQWNDPNGVMPVIDVLKPFLDPLKFYMLFHMTSLFNIQRETAMWHRFYPNCKALILYDFNKDCYDMTYYPENGTSLPVIYINGSLGDTITNNIDDFTLDFDLKQRHNESIISYNVIGEIKGIDESKTVILSCLYDSWWCQGTADSAIGMGIILAIAKYFTESEIKPKYNLKFIGFSGEEYNLRGAFYYEAIHKDENIIAIVDVNQVGFTQEEPRLTLDFVSNKLIFLNNIIEVANKSNYIERTGNVTDVQKIWWPTSLIPGNSGAFAQNRLFCNAFTLFKDGGWVLHHRDGLSHTEGDVLKYFNWNDTEVTAEILLNITKSLVTDEFGSFRYNNQPNLIASNFRVSDLFHFDKKGEKE